MAGVFATMSRSSPGPSGLFPLVKATERETNLLSPSGAEIKMRGALPFILFVVAVIFHVYNRIVRRCNKKSGAPASEDNSELCVLYM